MDIKKLEENIEVLAEKVHKAWWKEKDSQGYHSPNGCRSESFFKYYTANQQDREQFAKHNDLKFHTWCENCHPDMYPYGELREHIKEYDRVTVRTVLKAISELD